MRKRHFTHFSRTLCIKINFVTSFILLLLFLSATFFLHSFHQGVIKSSQELQLENGFGAMAATILAGAIAGFIIISYSILVPLFIPMFYNFRDNLKSLIGLFSCTSGITYYLYDQFTLSLALSFFVPIIIGAFGLFFLRYNNMQRNNKVSG